MDLLWVFNKTPAWFKAVISNNNACLTQYQRNVLMVGFFTDILLFAKKIYDGNFMGGHSTTGIVEAFVVTQLLKKREINSVCGDWKFHSSHDLRRSPVESFYGLDSANANRPTLWKFMLPLLCSLNYIRISPLTEFFSAEVATATVVHRNVCWWSITFDNCD